MIQSTGQTVTKKATMNARRLLLLLSAAMLAVLSVGGGIASAHSGDQTYIYLDVTPDSLGGRLEIPIEDLQLATGLELGDDDAAIEAAMIAEQDVISAYLSQHLAVTVEGASWPITFSAGSLFFSDLPEADDNYVIVPFAAEVPDGEVPRVFDLTFDAFFDEIPGRDALLLIGNDWEGGVIDNGHDITVAFDGSSRTQTVDLGDSSWFKTVFASMKLGVNHIRTGPDHILFVLVLLLPSVLIFTTTWQPAPSFLSALWRVAKVVSMFTLAHSITFTLAGLEILPLPPSKIVEAIIAASIAAAALHNLRPITHGREWLLSFAFGLFHGMGFASLVDGLDVPKSTQLLSLLGRNLGIELGQTVVVFLCFPALFLLRRTRFYRPFFAAASLALAAISIGWMIERLAEVDLGMASITDPLVEFPRILVIIALATVAAWAFYANESKADRLIGTGETPASDDRVEELVPS